MIDSESLTKSKASILFFLASGWFIAISGKMYLVGVYHWLALLFGLALTLCGSYIWVKRKNRHAAFTLFGIFSPIGLLPILLLKNKNSGVGEICEHSK